MAKAEVNGDRTELNALGVYVHNESGNEIIASSDIQADAFVRLGFVYKGEYNPNAVEEVAEKPLSKQTRAELEATAQAEGFEITDDLRTNKQLADAIAEHRSAQEGK
jgi:hypothetical protein